MPTHIGTAQFPIHYDDGHLQVYTNQCGELFVKCLKTGTTLRMKHHDHTRGGIEFTTDERAVMVPMRVTNMVGWLVESRIPQR